MALMEMGRPALEEVPVTLMGMVRPPACIGVAAFWIEVLA